MSGILLWQSFWSMSAEFSYLVSGWEDTHDWTQASSLKVTNTSIFQKGTGYGLDLAVITGNASWKENAILPRVYGLPLWSTHLLKAGSCWCIYGDLMESWRTGQRINMIVFQEVPCSAKNEEEFCTSLTCLPGLLDSWPYYPMESYVWFNWSLLCSFGKCIS